MAECPVAANCCVPTHCPYCVEGSEYRPLDRGIPFPAHAERQAQATRERREWKESAAHKGGKRSALKGKRAEREIARLLGGRRVPLSGALDGLPNDVVLPNGWRCEVKVRRRGLERFYRGLAASDVLLIEEEELPRLAVMGLHALQAVMAGAASHLEAVPFPRPGGTATIRRWMAAENAAVLLFKADRKGWLAVIEADRMGVFAGGDHCRSQSIGQS